MPKKMNYELSKEQLKTLKRFENDLIVKGLAEATRKNYFCQLKKFGNFLKKPFEKTTKEDLTNFYVGINGENIRSINASKVVVKLFYRWLSGKEEYPEMVKWIKLTNKDKEKLPEELLTPEEVMKMIKASDNIRDKAIVITLYESGCRLGELLGLKIKHVSFDEHGCKITITRSKTKQRSLRLIQATSYLTNWLNCHPFRDNQEYSLFINQSYNQYGKDLRQGGVNHRLKTLGKRAGIKKKIYPHLFRHSRFTELAKDFSESEMKILAGWSGGSNMPKTYIHLSGSDVEKKILEKAGKLTRAEIVRKEYLKPINCPRCSKENPAEAKYCNCGQVLDLKEAQGLFEKKLEAEDIINSFLASPQIQEQLKEHLRQRIEHSN